MHQMRGGAGMRRVRRRMSEALCVVAMAVAASCAGHGVAQGQSADPPERDRVALIISVSEYDGVRSDQLSEYAADFRTVPNDLNLIRDAVRAQAEPTSSWQLEGGRVDVEEMNALIDQFVSDLLERDDDDPKPIAFVYYAGLTAHGVSGDNLFVPSNAFHAENGVPFPDRMVRLERLLWVLREHTHATLLVVDSAYPSPRGPRSVRNTSLAGFGFRRGLRNDLSGGADAPTNDNVMMVFLNDPTDTIDEGERGAWPAEDGAPNCSAFAFNVARLLRSNQVVTRRFPDFLQGLLSSAGASAVITENNYDSDLFNYYMARPGNWEVEIERRSQAVEEERAESGGSGPIFRRRLRDVVELDHSHDYAFELGERYEQDALYEEALETYMNLIDAGEILGRDDVARRARAAADALRADFEAREGSSLIFDDGLGEFCGDH